MPTTSQTSGRPKAADPAINLGQAALGAHVALGQNRELLGYPQFGEKLLGLLDAALDAHARALGSHPITGCQDIHEPVLHQVKLELLMHRTT